MPSTLAELLSALGQADVDPRVADALSLLRRSYSFTGTAPDGHLPVSPAGDGAASAPPPDLELWLGSAVRERGVPADLAPRRDGVPRSDGIAYEPSSDAERLIEAGAAAAARSEVVALLDRALRLAFQCGVRVAAGVPADGAPDRSARLRAFTRVFELLGEGVLLVDDVGRTAYVNPALAAALRQDVERDHVLRRMRQLASNLPRGAAGGVQPVATCEVRTATDRYQLRATRLDDDLTGLERIVAVTVERTTTLLPSASSLAQRFGLTAAEASVARLLAQGYSNSAVARKLGISPHTAHHHTESVLLKLDVHSRAEVGPKVLGTRRPSMPVRAVRGDAPVREA